MIKDHEQFNLQTQEEIEKENPQTTGWDIAPNVARTDRDLNIKNKYQVTNNEVISQLGHKVKLHIIKQADSATYTALLDDFIVAVADAGVARTINLPKASLAGSGKVYVIKDASGSISSTTITIDPDGSELIDGDTTYVVSTNFAKVGVYCDGANWFTA